MTPEIIKATEVPNDGVKLIIKWQPDGYLTNEHVSESAAVALGWQRSPEPPPPPAWMVEVAREVFASRYEREGESEEFAASFRRGDRDDAPAVEGAVAALRLALERGHVGMPRTWTEGELLKSAREDAAQGFEALGLPEEAKQAKAGNRDRMARVQGALQARRNMLKEGAVGAAPVAPDVDWEAALRQAWDAGVHGAEMLILAMRKGGLQDRGEAVRDADVQNILSSLPTREA